MAKIPETYRDLKIVQKHVRFSNGKNVPLLVMRVQCDVKGHLLQANSWRALELQIDEQLDTSARAQAAVK